MTESGYTQSINRKLPSEIFKWKINCRFANGTPDAWYSARSDLWVEYKYVKLIPKKGIKPKLSALQTKWLNDRFDEGRNVAVIVGTPFGSFVYENKEWLQHKHMSDIMSTEGVLAYIKGKVL